MNTVRIIATLDIPADQATDQDALLEAIRARLKDEAGYLDDGPVTPSRVTVEVFMHPLVLTCAEVEALHYLVSQARTTDPLFNDLLVECETLIPDAAIAEAILAKLEGDLFDHKVDCLSG